MKTLTDFVPALRREVLERRQQSSGSFYASGVGGVGRCAIGDTVCDGRQHRCRRPPLKGPKLEIFVAEFFTPSKPVWIDDLGNRLDELGNKFNVLYVWGLIFHLISEKYFISDIGDSA
jgi:hypothetical protein